jgi:hypothetical protein
MKPIDILEKILEETYILSSALEAQDIDMALKTLERRSEWVDKFTSSNFDPNDQDLKLLIRKFDDENKLCIEKMEDFRGSMEVELNQVKTEKNNLNKNLKIHEQYSNPYVNDAVGNAFDLKK